MLKVSASISLALLAGCATNSESFHVDFSPVATLQIEVPDGLPVEIFPENTFSVDGAFGIGRNVIRLSPGVHYVRFSCPQGELAISHGPPAVGYTFEAGREYTLRCRDGFIAIAPR